MIKPYPMAHFVGERSAEVVWFEVPAWESTKLNNNPVVLWFFLIVKREGREAKKTV